MKFLLNLMQFNMFKQIRTSKENKEVVSQLSRRLNLGAENVIARIALTYSLSKDRKLNLKDIANSSGKEYSKSVLFGNQFDLYLGMVSSHYGLYKTDQDLPRYIKMHIDDGLALIDAELKERPNVGSFEFLAEKVGDGIKELS